MLYIVNGRDWWNNYWRLGRKIRDAGGFGPNEIMRARLLLESAPRSGAESPAQPGTPPSPEEKERYRVAIQNLEEVIAYGTRSFEAELAARKAQAHLDHHSGDPHS